MNYTLHQLQIFLKVAETQSITRAADELHLTQPAVSIQLKNFQAQFEIPLVENVGRNIYITAFGKEIANAAATIIDQVQAIDYKTAMYRGQMSGRLKISVVSTGKYIMPYFLSGFLSQNPSVELVMDVTNKRQVIASLFNNEVDFALVSVLPSKMDFEKIDLLKNRLYLVGNSSGLTQKDTSLEIFKDLPLIFREEGSGTRQTMNDFLARNEIPYVKKMELTSNEAVKQAVIAGMGYSIMPVIGLKNELFNNDMHILPVKGLPITTMWSLIYRKGKKHSPVGEAYLAYLSAFKDEIIKHSFKWYDRF